MTKHADLKGHRFLIAICLIAIMIFMVRGHAFAATILVPNNFTTIQAAINAANPGDVILVENGVYNEKLSINKTISIIGISGRPIVNYNYPPTISDPVINIIGPCRVEIQNIEVNGGTYDPLFSDYVGGSSKGIYSIDADVVLDAVQSHRLGQQKDSGL